eukprot:6470558-Amphidinium_carterae.1
MSDGPLPGGGSGPGFGVDLTDRLLGNLRRAQLACLTAVKGKLELASISPCSSLSPCRGEGGSLWFTFVLVSPTAASGSERQRAFLHGLGGFGFCPTCGSGILLGVQHAKHADTSPARLACDALPEERN